MSVIIAIAECITLLRASAAVWKIERAGDFKSNESCFKPKHLQYNIRKCRFSIHSESEGTYTAMEYISKFRLPLHVTQGISKEQQWCIVIPLQCGVVQW